MAGSRAMVACSASGSCSGVIAISTMQGTSAEGLPLAPATVRCAVGALVTDRHGG
jgi:hypothetical protein